MTVVNSEPTYVATLLNVVVNAILAGKHIICVTL